MRLHNLILAAAAVSSVASVPINVVRDASPKDANNALERVYSSLFKRVSPDVPPIMLFGQLVAPNKYIEQQAQTAQSSLAAHSHNLPLDVQAEVPSSPTQLSQPAAELQASPLRYSASTSTSLYPAFAAGSKRKAAFAAEVDPSATKLKTEIKELVRLKDGTAGRVSAAPHLRSPFDSDSGKHLDQPSTSLPRGTSKSPEHSATQATPVASQQHAVERDVSTMSTTDMMEEVKELNERILWSNPHGDPTVIPTLRKRIQVLKAAIRDAYMGVRTFGKPVPKEEFEAVLEALDIELRFMRLTSDDRKRGEDDKLFARIRALPQAQDVVWTLLDEQSLEGRQRLAQKLSKVLEGRTKNSR